MSPLRASPATTSPDEAVATPAVQRPGLTFQALIDAVWPSWFEGALAHSRVADDVLARYSSWVDRAGILSALDWMMLQRRMSRDTSTGALESTRPLGSRRPTPCSRCAKSCRAYTVPPLSRSWPYVGFIFGFLELMLRG